jgi:hypothetical protein
VSLLLTPDTDPLAAVRTRLRAVVAQPPPPLSLADRLADLAAVRRLFPALSPECDELEALLRRGVVA